MEREIRRRPSQATIGNIAGYLTAHWGATPCIKIVRTMGLDLPI
jgi:hypothetical protein